MKKYQKERLKHPLILFVAFLILSVTVAVDIHFYPSEGKVLTHVTLAEPAKNDQTNAMIKEDSAMLPAVQDDEIAVPNEPLIIRSDVIFGSDQAREDSLMNKLDLAIRGSQKDVMKTCGWYEEKLEAGGYEGLARIVSRSDEKCTNGYAQVYVKKIVCPDITVLKPKHFHK